MTMVAKIRRFLTYIALVGIAVAGVVLVGASFAAGTDTENGIPPCEFVAHDGTTLLLTREEANTASQTTYNANGIAPEASLTAPVAITCNP